uniref:Cyclin-like domain-containing protein n=1 Tax=Xenopus tropicalis TaxID=8364 RepID=A0A6I8SGG1_XENTR
MRETVGKRPLERDQKARERVMATFNSKKRKREEKRSRCKVINILIKVQRHFSLDFSTLCLSVNYLARYISQRPLKATILKPLGATCLYLATKIMGRKRPSAEDFLELFGDANYTPAYIAYVEKNLMCQLDYRLQGPTIDFFLEHFSLIRASSEKCSGIITRAANALTATMDVYNTDTHSHSWQKGQAVPYWGADQQGRQLNIPAGVTETVLGSGRHQPRGTENMEVVISFICVQVRFSLSFYLVFHLFI